ncbi:1-(5-phosphoribosyl)-5-[(5-phosphoribosylamino)methylideneamino] imidazole-4-carboxamide isomerase [Chitinophaga costaii]|uniref:1-(5-phosphoribosyl)-5-[(5-phosphoribosylamino)methylideneamino] imidazole-4-carboxamide isomerase n=1 Tax=Chitinophaga costaii TaxID=1335309 RepID=A0A1C3ZK29_9BACT|nr:1-(5-phosphoribosyl)-5-[(5-phosphoribosylamino)methylideneamino]imidazole-4-carboxamide isomerase [Chitinophaga costaii]PUZ30406.1 1-(5-phosphoribosyl)-5-[(5-phosphoribosylamino)methylideneamino]imidazole-4-carboxamide isomerase [Chitinophaga costaii]SCB82688.1 1-(5-phosphoribosyl)-5-[(5-phosphoribosylamino)methylideneamino] imidazole-4-carboxamide isomerase [Chitinophaga costaii]
MSATIREITVTDTLPLRRDVLYPHKDLHEVLVENDGRGLHYGVFEANRLVAVGSLFINGASAQFRKLATAPDKQGKGYGKLLLRHMARVAQAQGVTLLWCHARNTAQSFYTPLGFVQAGDYFEREHLIFCRMELPLDTPSSPFEIIPAIDLIDGKCVRLTQGDYAQQKVYNENPLEVALYFEDLGIRRLHLVDLDGAKKGQVVNWKVLETIAGKTRLVIDFGGGVKTDKDINIIFESGAAMATVGSVAVKEPALFDGWIKQYGPQKIMLGADVKGEQMAVAGWLETTEVTIFDFLTARTAAGVQQVFCTDVAKDGLLQGPSIDLYKRLLEAFPHLYFIASGGVAGMKDIYDLQQIGCNAVIVGKAIYEGRITMEELKTFVRRNETVQRIYK